MNPVSLDLPEGASVYNVLYPTKDPEYLVQDLLTVGLPNGYYIDVGWYPEHDPDGEYVIRVFFDSWENQQIDPIRTKDVNRVISIVTELCFHFGKGVVPRRSSDSQLIEPWRRQQVCSDDYHWPSRERFSVCASTGAQNPSRSEYEYV
jgi:hypothetical protein